MRFFNLDLNLLVVLDRLISESSVSQTAQQLNMTQPAVSNSLARLRIHFKDELMVQVGRRMAPTPFALSIQPMIRSALNQLQEVATTLSKFDPATAERTFTIISSDYVFMVFLTRVVRELSKTAPGIKLRVILTSEQTQEQLRQGQVDFVIVPEQRMVPEHPMASLFEDDFSCIAWAGNDAISDEITLEQYLQMEHVSTSLGPINTPHIEQETLEGLGVSRKIALYAPNFTLAADAILETPYIATLHSRAAKLLAERLPIKVLAPPLVIPAFSEVVQWHKNRSADTGSIWLRNFLVECGRNLSGGPHATSASSG